VREAFLGTRILRRQADQPEREAIIARIAAMLAAGPGIDFAYVFGSLPSPQPFCDIDVAAYLDSSAISPAQFLDVQLALTARLENALGIPADVVILNDAPLGLRLAAIRGRLTYSRDDARRLTFVEQTSLQAMDTAYLRHQSLRDLLTVRSDQRRQEA
jgi:predicted nucleotidyltransferase